MKENFKKLNENIRLTSNQNNDARTKYSGVAKKLHNNYYKSKYDRSTKFLFGSYKTKTNIRPLSTNQDVDLIFKIPKDTFDKYKKYESNGPSALLEEIKTNLKEKYTTTEKIKSWGKVVLVSFAENTHNVEVLPAFEQDDKTFIIPNTENGGSWDSFDPRNEIDTFQESNNQTNGLTAEVCRMVKTWIKNTSSLTYKSYSVNTDVIEFLSNNYNSEDSYSKVMKDFFVHLENHCDEDIKSHVTTAKNRATKAVEYEEKGKHRNASEEWIKIFGKQFPISNDDGSLSKKRIITNPSSPYANN